MDTMMGEEEREELSAKLEAMESTMRKRSLGNVRFIGELYKLRMLSPKIMVSCVNFLLGEFFIYWRGCGFLDQGGVVFN